MPEDQFETITCNICGSDHSTVIFPSARKEGGAKSGEFRSSGDEPLADPLVRCTSCGFMYVNPRLKPGLVLDGYKSAVDEVFVSQAASRVRTFRRCLRIVQGAWGKAPGKILDVGTANGSFLKAARDAGWEVSGCEPSAWMGEWCRKNYGIDITPGTIFDIAAPNGSFDVITLWDVIEHTPDPKTVLERCSRLLKKGGLLAVNYPDAGSWITRLMGRKWVFYLSVHYFYYTRKTMRLALEKAGFEVLKMRPHFQSLELDYILFRASAYVGALAKVPRAVFARLGLGGLQVPYWIGQTMVIARKKQT